MKGKNCLQLNQATMCEAIQYWLDSKFSGRAPRVESVTFKDGYEGDWFIVETLAEGERDPKDPHPPGASR